MLVEIEVPNDDLLDTDIKLKVAMQSTETYFMLSSVTNWELSISDDIIQDFYVQIFSGMALNSGEEKTYFDVKGEIQSRYIKNDALKSSRNDDLLSGEQVVASSIFMC